MVAWETQLESHDTADKAFSDLGLEMESAAKEEKLFEPKNELTSNNIKNTIRRAIYQHSSGVTALLDKGDYIHRVDSGVWELRDESCFPLSNH